MYCYTGILFVMLCQGWVSNTFIWRKPTVMRTNNQGITNLYGSVVFHFQHRLLFLGPSKPQWFMIGIDQKFWGKP